MPYFNGGLHGFNTASGYVPPAPVTAIYCDACAETCIPLPPKTGKNDGQRHWDTGFRWCPSYGGNIACTSCGSSVDRREVAP